ncbi:MAG: tetratricopeptide repeat protein [Phycisphaerae bacterium]|jgi:Flp pilus assembly protein TadD
MQSISKIGLIIVLIIAVCAAVLIAHWPALSAQAISIDDLMYFVDNHLVRNPSWDSAKRFLTEVLEPSIVQGYYQPLTMISLMLDYKIGGPENYLRQFHLTSLVFHIANTALIVILLYQLFGNIWIAAAVGLLFGVHPLTVEPIPWIGERKTLLAAFFTFLSLIFYVRYVRKGSSKAFIGCAVMFVLSLIAKPTSTPLPVMLLLMDFWPLNRLNWKNILEKLPIFIIAGVSAVITYISQARTASIITPETYGFARIPFLICHDIVFYLSKMIWPVNLTSHYPFPVPFGFANPAVMTGVAGSCLLIILLVISLRWVRAAATGFAIFFVMVFPTMQTLQFSDAVAADKYVYLPAIGLLMALAAFLIWCLGKTPGPAKKITLVAVILSLAVGESFVTRSYLADWKDSVSLYARMARISPGSVYANNNLGAALAVRGDIEQAVEYFNKILKIDPNDIDARMNIGKIFADQGKYDEAMSYYTDAMRLAPNDAAIYNHIAVIFIQQGRLDDAIAVYRKGLEYNTNNPAVLHTGLGTLLFRQGKAEEAIKELQEGVKFKPDATTFNNLGVALASVGRLNEAIVCHKKAIGLNPKNAEAYYDLGNIMLATSKFDQAADEYSRALQIKPEYAKAHSNLAIVFAQQGKLDEAIEHFAQASAIEPNDIGMHYNLAMALTNNGLLEDAEIQYREILTLLPNDTDALCALGDILLKQGKFEQAAVEYHKALALNPNEPRAQQGLENIPDSTK